MLPIQWLEYDSKNSHFSGFKGTMKIKSGAGDRLILNHFSKFHSYFHENFVNNQCGKTINLINVFISYQVE